MTYARAPLRIVADTRTTAFRHLSADSRTLCGHEARGMIFPANDRTGDVWASLGRHGRACTICAGLVYLAGRRP